MTTPRLFISYSHDSATHKEWVLQLATRLRQAGIDAILDMWDLGPGDDLPAFMERNLASADRVLMICTDKYVDKANAGTGGVGYEKMIVTADLMRSIDSNKVIPIIRQGGTNIVPTFLSTKRYLDFSREEQFEFGFDELVRSLHKAPLFAKPELGDRPTFDAPAPASKTGDPILSLMKSAVHLFEDAPDTEYLPYTSLVTLGKRQGMSRMYFDVVLQEAVGLGLLRCVNEFLVITPLGRKYALENGLA
jgi:hypothetical protein